MSEVMVPRTARAFSRAARRHCRDAARVLAVEGHEIEGGARGDRPVALAVTPRPCPSEIERCLPALQHRFRRARQQRQALVRIEHAREVHRTLEVARHPVEMIGGAAQHSGSHRAAPRRPARPSTQVSLVPPPCEELTTSEPSRSATRVRPPGTTVISRPGEYERTQVDVARRDARPPRKSARSTAPASAARCSAPGAR